MEFFCMGTNGALFSKLGDGLQNDEAIRDSLQYNAVSGEISSQDWDLMQFRHLLVLFGRLQTLFRHDTSVVLKHDGGKIWYEWRFCG
jgi:hypothetical protein